MEQFSKGEISRQFYLKEMGAISLKADRKAKRMVPASEVTTLQTSNVNVTMDDSDSQDSLSETRPFAENSEESSSSGQEDPFVLEPDLQPRQDRALQSRGRGKKATKKKQLCPECKKDFQLRRSPPLHVACCGCQVLYHKRCRKNLADKFFCPKCKSAPSSPPLGLSPAAVPDAGLSPAVLGVPSSHTPPSNPETSNPACSQTASSTVCCDELLLAEEEVPAPAPCLPSYTDFKVKV